MRRRKSEEDVGIGGMGGGGGGGYAKLRHKLALEILHRDDRFFFVCDVDPELKTEAYANTFWYYEETKNVEI